MPTRLVDVPGLTPTRINAPSPSAAAASAPAQGLGELAEGIASVSRPFAQISGQIQAAENSRQLSEVRTQLDTARTEHLIALESIQDPAAHLRLTDEFLQESRQIADRADFSPAVRDRLALDFDEWATETRNRVAANTANLAQKRAMQATQNELDAASATGNEAAFNQALADNPFLTPEEKDELHADFEVTRQLNTLNQVIDEDPLEAAEQLNDPNFRERYPRLTDGQINALRRRSNIEANRSKSKLWNDVINGALDGAILSDDDLKQMAEDGTITAGQRAQYLNTYHADAEPTFQPELYDAAFSAIQQYEESTDPTGAGIASLRASLATLPLPKEHIKELNKRLADRLGETQASTHRLTGDFQKITDQSFNEGKFGDWFSYGDHDNDPRTMNRKIIDFDDYRNAMASKRVFLDAWDAYLKAAPEDLDPKAASEAYDALFDSVVLENDNLNLAPLIPEIPAAINFNQAVDDLLPPLDNDAPPTSSLGTFGGQPILSPGTYYQNARPTVFGGPDDPVDNGLSAFGGKTGKGGREGVAIPADVLRATFPGKSKKWWSENVRVHVTTTNGAEAVFPVADLGTAEWVWKRDGRPVLDLTPGAASQLGGTVQYRNGKLSHVEGLDGLRFAITSTESTTPAASATWEDFWQGWFTKNNPKHAEQIASSLPAMLAEFAAAKADG